MFFLRSGILAFLGFQHSFKGGGELLRPPFVV